MLKNLILACALPCLASAQAGEIVKVDGKQLPSVPGPLTHTEYLRDPLSPFGNTGMELELRRGARGVGSVSCVEVPQGEVVEVAHRVPYPAGWQAYRVDVPAGGQIRARLRGDHEGWYVVRCVTRMGLLAPGMLRNLIHRGNPEGFYHNVGKASATAYFVVDTTEIVGGGEPYTLTFTRERPGPDGEPKNR